MSDGLSLGGKHVIHRVVSHLVLSSSWMTARSSLRRPRWPVASIFQFFRWGDAVFDLGSDTGYCPVELFLPLSAGLVGFLLDRSHSGGGSVSGVSNPRDARLGQEVPSSR